MPAELTSLEKKRHSLAHILAMAVLKLYPTAKLGVGPTTGDGFFYDCQLAKPIGENELEKLTKLMHGLTKQNLTFERHEKPIDEAIDWLKKQHQPFKVELAEDFKAAGETLVSFYQSGDFIDLCRGGHVRSTSEIDPDSFQLTRVAGAYWKGSEKNPQLQRLYGLAFDTQAQLKKHLERLKEAKQRDHRKLGHELDLFTFSPLVGSGLPLYTEKGSLLRRLVQNYVNDLQRRAGYQEVWTPQLTKAELFKVSGHYEKFKADMFRVSSSYTNDELFLKPMNCPMHTQIYASKPRSWRDLPIRYADFAMLYRDEKPGELGGLTRVRAFAQDDGHVFGREDQIEEEFDRALSLVKKVMETYGLSYWFRLSLRDPGRPDQYLGDSKSWDRAEQQLEEILKRQAIEYRSAPGEAAFYGPKIDLIAKDSLGREWQLSTIQLDFQMPRRFGLVYTDQDGQPKTPVMIHRAVNGSTERFLAIIIEHFGGKFPVWLSPVQAVVIPVSDQYHDFARSIGESLSHQEIRVEIKDSDETVAKKIRSAQLQGLPYMLVVGEQEQQTSILAVRTREGRQRSMKLEDLVAEIRNQTPD